VKLAMDRHTGEEYAVKIMALPEPHAKAGDNENTRYSACAVPSSLCYSVFIQSVDDILPLCLFIL
jgi:hypothetical protein